MKYKRKLFSILILFLMIFSISFVSANENVTNDISTNELSTLSVSNDNTIDENLNSANLNSVDTQNTNEVNSNSIENSNATEFKSDSVEESSSSNLDLEDGTLNTDEIESDDCLTKDGKVTNLRANKLSYDMSLTNGDAQAVMDAIQEISRNNGGTLYLNGQTYGGSAHARVWTGTGYRDIQAGENIYISNVRIVGGSEGNPNQFAKFQPYYENNTALSFAGYSTSLEGAGRYSSNSGVHLTNVTFEYLNCTERFFSFASGSLTNCVFDNLESYQHLFFVIGSFIGSTPIRLTNCNFTNSKQTYVGRLPAGGTDGTGQFGVVFGAEMYGCNFINTSTATHGGAFCLSDEWQSAACVPSKLIDCNFINITSRWFAVYIHGNYTETVRPITEPQVINNCKFINCTGSGEFGGALGISHNNVIINNTEFTNNTGGKGSAIMVGGINNTHDGFLGNNTEGNNITIENCVFKDNLAKTENQSYSNSTNPNFSTYPTGDAGAIYV
ncbi:MAG: hypothetical protein IKV87_00610, partial [Methanobrevibacter sp.]|nr:hypothetical protein [Methanobrevibacter sp.]